jgi:3-oxoacid CoA-transferase A subunit
MAIDKVFASANEAVADIHDGAVILVGGFGPIVSTPGKLLEAVSKLPVKKLTAVSNSGGFGIEVWGEHDVEVLHRTGQLKKHIVSAPVNQWMENTLEKRFRAGEVEIEMVAQGTLAEKIRAGKAGLGGILTPVGIGTELEKRKRMIRVDGRKYLLELAIKGDFAFVRAYKADRWGNLIYKGTSRTFNATMAGAARVTIAEVDEVVEIGELNPEEIVTPGVFVNRVVVR